MSALSVLYNPAYCTVYDTLGVGELVYIYTITHISFYLKKSRHPSSESIPLRSGSSSRPGTAIAQSLRARPFGRFPPQGRKKRERHTPLACQEFEDGCHHWRLMLSQQRINPAEVTAPKLTSDNAIQSISTHLYQYIKDRIKDGCPLPRWPMPGQQQINPADVTVPVPLRPKHSPR